MAEQVHGVRTVVHGDCCWTASGFVNRSCCKSLRPHERGWNASAAGRRCRIMAHILLHDCCADD
jgi:hypothetical protein